MEGKSISHFRILSRAGEGGMGVVYEAEDERLKRRVALKLLPGHLVADESRRLRFMREAQATAAVSHPSIAAIYEVGEDAGNVFLAMEFVEGSTLRAVLDEKPMSVADTLRVVTDVARGLERAHAAGVVHRDLKPGNIMVQPDDHAKILDFGLAKLRQEKEADAGEKSAIATQTGDLTREGAIMGTSGYMSPEQARGAALDGRSDLFSLGVVFYEMLAGRNPFRGDTAIETISSILKDNPPDVSQVNAAVPAGLAGVVRRLLAKATGDRYASATDLLADLVAHKEGSSISAPSHPPASPVAVGAGDASIAVLPFSDMSAAADQEYFCDGIAEELINALARVNGIRVAARTSAFQFKGKAEHMSRIGEALQVRTILEGSVRKAGQRLRVSTQLVKAADGYPIWSERYDRQMEDIFDLQDEITATIVEALKEKLGLTSDVAGKKVKPVVRHTQNVEAYNLYLQGRYYWNNRYEGGLQKAIGFFQQAIDKDPDYALAHAGIAEVYGIIGTYGFLPPKVAFAKAREACRQALALDASLSEAHLAQGWVSFFGDWDFAQATASYQRCLEISPDSVQGLAWYGIHLAFLGRFEEGIAAARRGQELDPLSPYAAGIVGYSLLVARRDEEAIVELQRALELDESSLMATYLMGMSLIRLSRYGEGIELLEKAVDVSGRAPFYLGLVGWAYGTTGRQEEARAILKELDERSVKEYVVPLSLAMVLASLGEMDAAFENLDAAVEERSGFLGGQEGLPSFDPLRADPRYQDVLRRIGFPSSLAGE